MTIKAPDGRLLRSGAWYFRLSALAGGSFFSIQSCQDFTLSLAHQCPLDFSVESGPRIGYRNM